MNLPNRPVAHTPRKDDPEQRWHYLDDHLKAVADLAERFAGKFGVGTLGYWAGLLHDLGKYHPNFQAYLLAQFQGKNHPGQPHAVYGAAHALENSLATLMLTIYGHHVGLQDPSSVQDKSQPIVDDEMLKKIVVEAGQHHPFNDLQQATAAEQALHDFDVELLIRMLFSALIDADHLDTEAHFEPEKGELRKFEHVGLSKLCDTFEQNQNDLYKRAELPLSDVNLVRREVYDLCIRAATQPPGVFRLAVPTGGGKTRSGLAFALKHAERHGHDKVIVAVPYTSIIEQTVDVYRSIFGYDAVLEHHSAVRESKSDNEKMSEAKARARLLTQNWDAPLIVTTTVQLFESLFANRTSRCRKLHNVANSIIILDEVQTLPLELLEPTLAVLRELVKNFGVTVLLCTATQPAFEADSKYLNGFVKDTVQDIIPPDLAKEHFKLLRRVHYDFREEPVSWTSLASEVFGLEQVLVILNTRKDALELLTHLDPSREKDTFHLSTLLCGQHRRDVLAEVKRRLEAKESCLLISTQVVEAGVDLDFPTVFRALGPLDRIVQAAGRCNREGRLLAGGQVVIFEPQGGGMPRGNYATAYSESKRFLESNINLHDPDVFESYFSSLYQLVDTDKHKVQQLRTALNFPRVAEEYRLIREDTVPVVVPYGEVEKQLKRIRHFGKVSSKDYRALQPYVVSLRRREFEEHQASGLVAELLPDSDVWLWRGNYDNLKGLSSATWDPADLVY